MKKHLFSKLADRLKAEKSEELSSLMMRYAFSYSIFLFVILILAVFVHHFSTQRTQEAFWYQNDSVFDSAVSLLDNDLTLIDSYCRQLAQDSTMIRAARMTSSDDPDFYMAGYSLKQSMSSHLYSYTDFPVNTYFAYLRNSQYVASINSFHSDSLFYSRNYKALFTFDEWQDLLCAANGSGSMYPLEYNSTNSTDDCFLYLVDLDSLVARDLPVTAGFNFSYEKIKRIFSNIPLGNGGAIVAYDADGTVAFYLSDASNTYENNSFFADNQILEALSFDSLPSSATYFDLNGTSMRLTCANSSASGLTFYLMQPESICPSNYQGIFFVLLAVAAIVAVFLILQLARNNMRPIEQLHTELTETISDRNQLKEVIEATRPILSLTYLRRLMTGSIGSDDEFSYVRNFLQLTDNNLRYYVMYCVAYENGFMGDAKKEVDASEDFDDLIHQALNHYFSYHGILYLYSPDDRVYALLLPFTGADDAALISIQEKMLKLHQELLEENSIWFFAGIGRACPLQNVWESYQQAKEVSGYTAKNYIFLPYEMLKKDSHAYYYPTEFSTKLVTFITSGSKAQIIDLFNLIHEENIEDRNLSVQLLKFLLSDIRNTLLKARFALTNIPEGKEDILANVDLLLSSEHLSFRLCEDIALKLCDLFETNSPQESLIDTIVTYIRANFKDPSMCLSKISSEFHISESYFSHMFKEAMNINFSVYLEDLRLNEAARMIQAGPANLNEVALEVGYNSITSFRRAFKKKFGVTPSAMIAN